MTSSAGTLIPVELEYRPEWLNRNRKPDPVFEEFEDYHPPYEYLVVCMLCKAEGTHPSWMLHHVCEVES